MKLLCLYLVQHLLHQIKAQQFYTDLDLRVDSRIFSEGANSPLVFPKGGQPANQMGSGVFLKKKHCRQPLHPLKNTADRPCTP